MTDSYNLGRPRDYMSKTCYFHTTNIGSFGLIYPCAWGDVKQRPKYISHNGMDLFPVVKDVKEFHPPLHLNDYKEQKIDETDKSVDKDKDFPQVLFWVVENGFDIDDIDFVCHRITLVKIGLTIYDYYKRPWSYRITKYKGVCYISHIATLKVKSYDKEKKGNYTGFRFREILTDETPILNIVRDNDFKGNLNSYYSTLNMIGKHKFLSYSQTDGIDPETKKVVELKVKKLSGNRRNSEYYFRKNNLHRAWLQAYLSGCDRIIYGLQDGDGIVQELREYTTSRVPDECCEEWSSLAIMGFLEHVLDWALPKVQEGKSYYLEYNKNGDDMITLCQQEEFYLPEIYMNYVNK